METFEVLVESNKSHDFTAFTKPFHRHTQKVYKDFFHICRTLTPQVYLDVVTHTQKNLKKNFSALPPDIEEFPQNICKEQGKIYIYL